MGRGLGGPGNFLNFFGAREVLEQWPFFAQNGPKMQFFGQNFLTDHLNQVPTLDNMGRSPRRPWEIFGFFWCTGSVGAVTCFAQNGPKMQFFSQTFLTDHLNQVPTLYNMGRGPRRPWDFFLVFLVHGKCWSRGPRTLKSSDAVWCNVMPCGQNKFIFVTRAKIV